MNTQRLTKLELSDVELQNEYRKTIPNLTVHGTRTEYREAQDSTFIPLQSIGDCMSYSPNAEEYSNWHSEPGTITVCEEVDTGLQMRESAETRMLEMMQIVATPPALLGLLTGDLCSIVSNHADRIAAATNAIFLLTKCLDPITLNALKQAASDPLLETAANTALEQMTTT